MHQNKLIFRWSNRWIECYAMSQCQDGYLHKVLYQVNLWVVLLKTYICLLKKTYDVVLLSAYLTTLASIA